jgi:hypothetical protein
MLPQFGRQEKGDGHCQDEQIIITPLFGLAVQPARAGASRAGRPPAREPTLKPQPVSLNPTSRRRQAAVSLKGPALSNFLPRIQKIWIFSVTFSIAAATLTMKMHHSRTQFVIPSILTGICTDQGSEPEGREQDEDQNSPC